MIVKEEFYNVECDCCHCLADEDTWRVEERDAEEVALDNDWREFEGKHYCPNCWKLDDDENIVTKDGKVWDWDTEELIKTIESMNPNSMCVVENEVLRARLKRNKELAVEIRHIMRAPGRLGGDDAMMILQKLNEIINGK